MRETDEHSYEDPREAGASLRPILSGWALWAVIMLGFAVWAGVRALLPAENQVMAGIDGAHVESRAPAAGSSADGPPADGPRANDNFVLRVERPAKP
jgi:hypothetical protein